MKDSIIRGLMPKQDGYRMSRDYYIDIECLATDCFLNNNKKCSSPSLISLNVNAKCIMYNV